MTTYPLSYLLSAAYFAGVGSAVMLFGLFVRAADGKHASASCFVRVTVLLCFGLAAYLLFEAWRLA